MCDVLDSLPRLRYARDVCHDSSWLIHIYPMSICSIESEIHHNVLLFSVTGEKHCNNVRRAAV